MSNKGIVSIIYKGLLQLNNKKTNTQSFKWTKDPNRYILTEDLRMAKSHLKDKEQH